MRKSICGAVSLLALAGCSFSTTDRVLISVSYSQENAFFSVVPRLATVPGSPFDMSCFVVNISGDGVVANASGNIGPTTTSCLGLNLTSMLSSYQNIRSGVDLAAPVGTNRTIQIFGAKSTQVALSCPVGEPLGSLYDTEKYAALYLLGSINSAIYGGLAIDVPATYSAATAKDLVLECVQSQPQSDVLLLTGVSPSRGSNAGGAEVTLTGLGFQSGMTVSIGSVSCQSVSVTSTSQATCTTQSAPGVTGTYDVTVTNLNGKTTMISNGFKYMKKQTWTAITSQGAPQSRYDHSSIWTGSSLIIHGGAIPLDAIDTGGVYTPETDQWSAIASSGSVRFRHTAVWTGSQMIVWGGATADAETALLNTGAIYDLVTNTWPVSQIQTASAPSARWKHTAVWTGNTGNPATANKMIVWGGINFPNYNDTGGIYNPSIDDWTPTPTQGAPSGRESHTAIWTGSKMIIWGGVSINGIENTGGIYDPATNTWSATNTAGAPPASAGHTAIWTGSKMIIWGKDGSNNNTGGIYDPVTNTWSATSTAGAPSSRGYHTAIWTGSKMMIWGGYFLTSEPGGVYDLANDSWLLTSTINSPANSSGLSVVWTGSEMLIWGGKLFLTSGLISSGAFYVP